MISCQICEKQCKDKRGLARHLQLLHHLNNLKEYYDKYMKLSNEGYCLTCQKETSFVSLTHGYRIYCYNMNCISNSIEIKKKKQNTCLMNCGEITNLKCEYTKQKIKNTCLKKYGFDNPSKSELIKGKKLNTSISNFGTHQSACEKIKDKKRKTCYMHFGVNYPSQNLDICQKQIKTLKIHLKNSDFIESIRKKRTDTCISKYGVSHHSKLLSFKKDRRVDAIKRIEIQKLNGEPLMPNIGSQERPFLNELQKYTNYNIIRNDHSFAYTIARFPDGHIPELKLFIQFDERHHFKDKECTIYQDDDIQCTKDLESISGYQLLRISEKRWSENKQNVIDEFKQLIGDLMCQKKN